MLGNAALSLRVFMEDVEMFNYKTRKLLVLASAVLALQGDLVLAQTTPAQPAASQVQKVDLNKADAATLAQVLNGVGEAKAKAIVEYRNTHGPFKNIEQLEEVSGIGQSIVANNRDRLKIE
jgi:competence protein ComEA